VPSSSSDVCKPSTAAASGVTGSTRKRNSGIAFIPRVSLVDEVMLLDGRCHCAELRWGACEPGEA
jgi:hypothetical protein